VHLKLIWDEKSKKKREKEKTKKQPLDNKFPEGGIKVAIYSHWDFPPLQGMPLQYASRFWSASGSRSA
jgi:hypothetical protein